MLYLCATLIFQVLQLIWNICFRHCTVCTHILARSPSSSIWSTTESPMLLSHGKFSNLFCYDIVNYSVNLKSGCVRILNGLKRGWFVNGLDFEWDLKSWSPIIWKLTILYLPFEIRFWNGRYSDPCVSLSLSQTIPIQICLVPIPRKLNNSQMAADLSHLLSVDKIKHKCRYYSVAFNLSIKEHYYSNLVFSFSLANCLRSMWSTKCSTMCGVKEQSASTTDSSFVFEAIN